MRFIKMLFKIFGLLIVLICLGATIFSWVGFILNFNKPDDSFGGGSLIMAIIITVFCLVGAGVGWVIYKESKQSLNKTQ